MGTKPTTGSRTDGFGLNIATELARANGAELRLVSSREDETIFEVCLNRTNAA